jgi:hypothetical protein
MWGPSWLVPALLVGLPAIAEAQLLPNLPAHKRRRHGCENEPPMFRYIRHEYYGYHPTCWRRFPPGWGCPSPEAINPARVKADVDKEIEKLRAAATGGGGAEAPPAEGGSPFLPGPEPGANPPGDEPFPSLPQDRGSLLDDTTPGAPAPGGNPPGGDSEARPSTPVTPPAPTFPRRPADRSGTGPGASLDAPAIEGLPAASSEPPAPPPVALLDVGRPSLLPEEPPAGGFPPGSAAPPPIPSDMPAPPPPPIVQAPRRSLIGNLFSGIRQRIMR